MIYRMRLFKGILKPKTYLYQLEKAEVIKGLWVRLLLLIFASGLVFFIGGYFGIGSEFLSKYITEFSRNEFETYKLLVIIGQCLWGIFYAAVVLFLPALIYWALFEAEFRKLLVMQAFVLFFLIAEKVILTPFQITLGIGAESSPLSLGVITQYITDHQWLIHFSGTISIFSVIGIVIQYKVLKAITDKNPKLLLAIVILLNLIGWCLAAALSYLGLQKLM
ncbi:hypothetical protein C0971_16495 [Bacillus methanolicus]|uniref:hypothetical protein n=1 Tax=Bacillus methanolicus TaxID=1471 RepID=UPI00200FC7D7|nr:hypothetical protein [Bacillus methanolicus]UQD53440.1 hypothetical protein C0971_16495 [Bacillus methanolicus]